MKKILYIILGLALVSGSFTSCSDDDDNGSIALPANPASDIAGTYTGTWTRIALTDSTTITADGTITLTDSSTYAGSVTVAACSAVGLSEMSSPVNVQWNTSNTYRFFNYVSTNGLGMTFAGSVLNATDMTFKFTKTVRSGRKTSDFSYTFIGKKQ